MGQEELIKLLEDTARSHGLDPALVVAIARQESALNPWAMRFEANWDRYQTPLKFAKSNKITLDTEKQLQRFSFGIGQIMGATARWRGFDGPLVSLCSPEVGAIWMCKHIQKIAYKSMDDVISAYNAGTPVKLANGKYKNQAYVNGVKSFIG